MSRRTPVKELLEEENAAPSSPRRRSTRIAASQKPTSVDEAPARIRRSQRNSLSHDDSNSTSPARSLRSSATRSVSRSPTNLTNIPARRTRRSASTSSIIDEEIGRVSSPAPRASTRRKSISDSEVEPPSKTTRTKTDNSKSSGAISTTPTPAKTRGRRLSVTETITPLEVIEEIDPKTESETKVENAEDDTETETDQKKNENLPFKKKVVMMKKLQTIEEKGDGDEKDTTIKDSEEKTVTPSKPVVNLVKLSLKKNLQSENGNQDNNIDSGENNQVSIEEGAVKTDSNATGHSLTKESLENSNKLLLKEELDLQLILNEKEHNQQDESEKVEVLSKTEDTKKSTETKIDKSCDLEEHNVSDESLHLNLESDENEENTTKSNKSEVNVSGSSNTSDKENQHELTVQIAKCPQLEELLVEKTVKKVLEETPSLGVENINQRKSLSENLQKPKDVSEVITEGVVVANEKSFYEPMEVDYLSFREITVEEPKEDQSPLKEHKENNEEKFRRSLSKSSDFSTPKLNKTQEIDQSSLAGLASLSPEQNKLSPKRRSMRLLNQSNDNIQEEMGKIYNSTPQQKPTTTAENEDSLQSGKEDMEDEQTEQNSKNASQTSQAKSGDESVDSNSKTNELLVDEPMKSPNDSSNKPQNGKDDQNDTENLSDVPPNQELLSDSNENSTSVEVCEEKPKKDELPETDFNASNLESSEIDEVPKKTPAKSEQMKNTPLSQSKSKKTQKSASSTPAKIEKNAKSPGHNASNSKLTPKKENEKENLLLSSEPSKEGSQKRKSTSFKTKLIKSEDSPEKKHKPPLISLTLTESESETENFDLNDKIDKLIEKRIKIDSGSSDEESIVHYLDDMAEEGEEDTPSDGSNDIIDEGESIGSTESEIDSDESYELDSFIDDNEDQNELLSGDEYDLGQETKKSKGNNAKGKARKKYKRLLSSDSEESAENDDKVPQLVEVTKVEVVKNKTKIVPINGIEEDSDIDKMSTQPYCGLTPPSILSVRDSLSDSDKVTDTKSETNSVSTKYVLNKDDNLKSLEEIRETVDVQNDKDNSNKSPLLKVISNQVLDTTKSPGDGMRLSNTLKTSLINTPNNSIMEDKSPESSQKKRLSSLSIQENIALKDIEGGNVSDRITSMINIFCSSVKGESKDSMGNISLNVSLEYTKSPQTESATDETEYVTVETTEEKPVRKSLEFLEKIPAAKEEIICLDEEDEGHKEAETEPRPTKKKRRSKTNQNASANLEMSTFEVPETATEPIIQEALVESTKKKKKRSHKKKQKENVMSTETENETSENNSQITKFSSDKSETLLSEDLDELFGYKGLKELKKTKYEEVPKLVDDSLETKKKHKKRKNIEQNNLKQSKETASEEDQIIYKKSKKSTLKTRNEDEISSDEVFIQPQPVELKKSKKSKINTHENLEEPVPKGKVKKRKYPEIFPSKSSANINYLPSSMIHRLVENEKKSTAKQPEMGHIRKPKLVPSTNMTDLEWESNMINSPLKPTASKKPKIDPPTFTNKDFKNKMLYNPDRVKRVETKALLKKKQKIKM